MITLTSTVSDAKAWLRTRLREGDECPVCAQRVQMYRRNINARQARALTILYRECGTDWGHVPSLDPSLSGDGGMIAYLRHWGLIEEWEGERPDGGRAGWWRCTPLGAEFVQGSAVVPKYVLLYNGKSYGLEGEDVNIESCLGKKFDLRVLLNGG